MAASWTPEGFNPRPKQLTGRKFAKHRHKKQRLDFSKQSTIFGEMTEREPIDYRTPIDDLEPEEMATYRELALIAHDYALDVLRKGMEYIVRSENARIAAWQMAYAIPIQVMCKGISQTERCRKEGITNRETFSKGVVECQQLLGLPPNEYQKTETACAAYSRARHK